MKYPAFEPGEDWFPEVDDGGVAPVWLALCFAVRSAPVAGDPSAELPTRIRIRRSGEMITEFSEPDGNTIRTAHQRKHVPIRHPGTAADLSPGARIVQGGANFTYVVALRPGLAFIIDIRRQNMLEHLLYKALIELFTNRVEFIAIVLEKPRGPWNRSWHRQVVPRVLTSATSRELFERNLQDVDRLVKHHGFALTDEDLNRIEYVYNAFYEHGPDLRYTFEGAGIGVLELFPAYTELMTATDGNGEQRGYLATEENFRILKELQQNNAIIPLVGDFAGPTAIRSVGRYIKERGASVMAFYLSNVEQYLFQQEDTWKRFYLNVSTLPINESSTIVRSVSDQNSVPGRLSIPARLISRPADRFSLGRSRLLGHRCDVQVNERIATLYLC